MNGCSEKKKKRKYELKDAKEKLAAESDTGLTGLCIPSFSLVQECSGSMAQVLIRSGEAPRLDARAMLIRRSCSRFYRQSIHIGERMIVPIIQS